MEILNFIGRFINYFSITLLTFGLLINLLPKVCYNKKWIIGYVFSLLLTECTALYIGVYLKQNILFLFTISFFAQFVFLTYFYCNTILAIKATIQNLLIGIGLLPLLLHCMTDSSLVWLQGFARVPYSLIISLYSLGYFYALMMGKLQNVPARNLFNGSILLFFTVDTFLGTANSYLLKREYLDLVAWFWFFRAIFLQFFYAALIYYGWKHPKET